MKLNKQQQKIFDSMTFKQQEVFLYDIQYKPIYTILAGAVRSGKTWEAEILWLLHVASMHGMSRKMIMSGYTIPALKKNVIDDLETILREKIRLDSSNSFNLFGNKMLCYGTDKVDSYKSARGFTAYGHYGNEVTLSHRNSIDQFIKRCSGQGSRFFWETNPDSPIHYIKTDYIDKAGMKLDDGRILIKYHHFELDDNTRLDPQYVEQLKKTTPPGLFYDRDIRGLWVASEGLVYKHFLMQQMTVEPPKNIVEVFAGVDFGFEHHGVIVVFGKCSEGKFYLLEEIAEQYKHIEWWLDRKKEIVDKYGHMSWYCDSARPEYVEKFNGINADKAVIEGISYVDSLMYNKNFFVACNAPRFLKEINGYAWKDSGTKEEPFKDNDDVMDAVRYALYTHRGIYNTFHAETTDDSDVFIETPEEFF